MDNQIVLKDNPNGITIVIMFSALQNKTCWHATTEQPIVTGSYRHCTDPVLKVGVKVVGYERWRQI